MTYTSHPQKIILSVIKCFGVKVKSIDTALSLQSQFQAFIIFIFLLKLNFGRKFWRAQKRLPIPNTACITPCTSFNWQPIVLSLLLTSYA